MSTENKPAYKQGFWKEHSEAWKTSGLTQAAYCTQQGISYQSFVYQHNRLVNKTKHTPLSFTEAKPELTGASTHAAGLQLMLPNGIRIGIGGEINTALLQTVLSVAGGIKC